MGIEHTFLSTFQPSRGPRERKRERQREGGGRFFLEFCCTTELPGAQQFFPDHCCTYKVASYTLVAFNDTLLPLFIAASHLIKPRNKLKNAFVVQFQLISFTCKIIFVWNYFCWIWSVKKLFSSNIIFTKFFLAKTKRIVKKYSSTSYLRIAHVLNGSYTCILYVRGLCYCIVSNCCWSCINACLVSFSCHVHAHVH